MSKLQPLNGYLILRPIEEEEQTYGNIVIPDLGKERPEMGEVVATSGTYNYNSDTLVSSNLAVGDRVLIPKLGSLRITVEGDEYFICKEQDVYSKIVPENPIAEIFKETEQELKKGDITGDHYFIADIKEQNEL
jgi:chaperonin GroES